MSTYKRITRHPNTTKYLLATWHDDYFGQHLYGVEFPGDKVVYPEAMVSDRQLKEFWVDDVMRGFRQYLTNLKMSVTTNKDKKLHTQLDDQLIIFLEYINDAYEKRWAEDPADGLGAADNEARKRGI